MSRRMFYAWAIIFALCFTGFGAALATGDVDVWSVGSVVACLALFGVFRYFVREASLPPRWLPVRVHLATGDMLDAVARRRWRRDEHGNVCYRVTQVDGSRLPDINSDAVRCYEVPILPGITYTFNRQTASHQRGSPNGD